MGDFNALAGTGKQNRMVAHDVATTDGGKTDGRRVTLARVAVTLVHGAVFEIAADGISNYLAHFQSSARGGIHLVAVMGFDDFNVVAGRHSLRSHLQELQGHVHTHAHVGRHDNGDVFGCVSDFCFLLIRKTRGANDQLDAQFTTNFQMRQGAFGAREVNQHVAVLQAFAYIGFDVHTAGQDIVTAHGVGQAHSTCDQVVAVSAQALRNRAGQGQLVNHIVGVGGRGTCKAVVAGIGTRSESTRLNSSHT